MKNIKLQIEIAIEDLKDIKGFHGANDIKTVEAVVNHILDRYLNVEYFDPKLIVED
jgi:hypothetical protein